MQQSFTKASLFNSLALAALIVGFQQVLVARRPPVELAARVAPLDYRPLALRFAPTGAARLGGAWRVAAADARLAGLSGLAVDRGQLLALTDSGLVARLDLPGTPRPLARIAALPAAPGDPGVKAARDSEALARDPRGRGWWVAFEQVHELRLYDPAFERLLARVPAARPGFAPNRGIEAVVATGRGVGAIPESSGVSDAVRLPDGRVARLTRRFTPGGIRSAVKGLGAPIALPLGPFDNPEGIAAAPLPDGGTRLWIVTDNDGSRWRPTLLLALDLPPRR